MMSHTSLAPDAPVHSPAMLDLYFARNRQKPARFAGQTDPQFQAALAAQHAGVTPDDCDFYHTIQTPDGRVYPGTWDLRDHESAYLGGVELGGRAVLEIAPASGWLSAFIAASARLTTVDLPFGQAPEMIPYPGHDMAAQQSSAALSAARLRNSWWFTKRCCAFDAVAAYADVYQLPPDLGRKDVAIFGAILLHLSNPFRALQEAAALTEEAIVVTDVLNAGLDARFSPSPLPACLTHWWALTPDVIERMLERLGFGCVTRTIHAPVRMSPSSQLFTVVGRKQARTTRSANTPPPPPPLPRTTTPTALPVPPPELRKLVAGTEDEASFTNLGILGFDALTASLRAVGTEPASVRRVLEFGCGVGRVTRHWARFPSVVVKGSDLSAPMIAWCRSHLTFATFNVNTLEPELPYADGEFDLVYAISVLTHLPEPLQLSWLQELIRITGEGGLIYLTTHGEAYLDLLSPAEKERFQRGELIVMGAEQPGSNQCAAFHPPAWMERLPQVLDVVTLQHLPKGALGTPLQDSWLLRRSAPQRR